MNSFKQDLVFGLRMLVKSPGFTIVAVLSLALGIGANTAIFSVVDKLMVRTLPVEAPQQLVILNSRGQLGDEVATETSFSYPLYKDYRDRNEVLSGVAAYSFLALNLTDGGQTERIRGLIVTGNYFAVLGVPAASGRTFLPEEDQTPGTHPVAVISHGLWQKRFGADPAVINKTILLNGQSFTVIGITPSEFAGNDRTFAPDIYVPMMMQPQALARFKNVLDSRNFTWLDIFGRLKPGVSREQAQASLTTISEDLAKTYPDNVYPETLLLDGSMGENTMVNTELSTPLWLLMATVGLVLAIACANIANLLLARATARRKEIAVRLTVGASRGRLIRQLLTESVLLSLVGGLLGLLIAIWLTDLLISFKPPVGNMSISTQLDWRVLGFSILLTFATGIIFGLAPAIQSSRTDLITAIKDEGAALGQGRRRFTLRNVLVVAQVALSLMVLIAAGLCLRSLRNLQAINLGFEPAKVLVASVDLALAGYKEEQGKPFYDQLLERVSNLPGVESASLARIIPLGNSGMRISLDIEGYTPAPNQIINFDVNIVGPQYFQTMRMNLASGRDFTAQDNQAGKKVVLINETAARTYWKDQSPIGRHLILGSPDDKEKEVLEIIGIVKDSKYRKVTDTTRTVMFLPVMQNYFPDLALHIRAATDTAGLIAAVRHEVQAIDANLPVYNVRTLEQQKSDSLYAERMAASLLSAFGILALLLSAMGIYGVMAYSVSHRTREIGIRMALGAESEDVLKMVLQQGMWLLLIGVVLGLAGAYTVTRWLESFLYEVSATDSLTFVCVPLLLFIVALLACFLPARRATKVDPMVALRYE